MRKQQRGYVLLVLMALVLSAGAGIFVTGVGKSVVERKASGDRKVLAQLKNIKQRLLTYAATHPEIYSGNTDIPGPGYLPCPTLIAEAVAASDCNGEDSRGWLPRRLSDKDVSFEAEGLDWSRVWYVLDNRFSVNTDGIGCGSLTETNGSDSRCYPLNTGLNPERIKLNGRTGYVALLIYAGGTLSGQNRSEAVPDVSDYLDGENADVDAEYSTSGASPDNAFNDIVLPITKQEWNRVIKARVSQSAVDGDWCGVTPVDKKAWFELSDWHETGQKICL